jgi:hypothetical protein
MDGVSNGTAYRDSDVGAVRSLDIESRMPVSTLVLDDGVTIGTSHARAARLLELIVVCVLIDIASTHEFMCVHANASWSDDGIDA